MDWKISKIVSIHLFYLILYLLKDVGKAKYKTHWTLCQYAARYASMYCDLQHSHSVKCAVILEITFLVSPALFCGFWCPESFMIAEGDTNCNAVKILCVNNI